MSNVMLELLIDYIEIVARIAAARQVGDSSTLDHLWGEEYQLRGALLQENCKK